jgi:hypothetical protein
MRLLLAVVAFLATLSTPLAATTRTDGIEVVVPRSFVLTFEKYWTTLPGVQKTEWSGLRRTTLQGSTSSFHGAFTFWSKEGYRMRVSFILTGEVEKEASAQAHEMGLQAAEDLVPQKDLDKAASYVISHQLEMYRVLSKLGPDISGDLLKPENRAPDIYFDLNLWHGENEEQLSLSVVPISGVRFAELTRTEE